MYVPICFMWTYLASLLQDISWLNILDALDKTWYEWSFIIDWEKVTKCQFPIKLVHDYSIKYIFTRLKWHKKPSNSKSKLTLRKSQIHTLRTHIYISSYSSRGMVLSCFFICHNQFISVHPACTQTHTLPELPALALIFWNTYLCNTTLL